MKLNKKYNLISSKEDLKALDDFLMNDDRPIYDLVAIDTETNGLNHWKDVVIGISLSVNNNSGFYIPLLSWEKDPDNPKDGHFKDFWRGYTYSETVTQKDYKVPVIIRKYIKRWFANGEVDILMHNAPFDCLMIENNFGVDLSPFVFCDVWLLKHAIDENTPSGLKETALLWQKDLSIPIEEEANKEQLEMGRSVTNNGGKYNKSTKHIWRCDLDVLYKYAIADTFLTYGVFEVGIQKFEQQYTEKHFRWFFEDEVMPLCREVVIPMKRNGVKIDISHFQRLDKEAISKIEELEYKIVSGLEKSGSLKGFTLGKTVDEAISKKRLIERIIELEGLEYPSKKGKDGKLTKSLAKDVVRKAYLADPHWLWGYILGEEELKYSSDKISKIKNELYELVTGKKYRFNINSRNHLIWLFFSRLGESSKDIPKTDSGDPSVKAEVLEEFFLKKYDFVKSLLCYKKLKKIHSTYIVPALQLNDNEILYMDFLQAGTTSGRFSCSGGLNLQTLPQAEELEKCSKCGSDNIKILHPIKLLAEVKCNECEHLEEDIITPSAIKEGFVAPEDEVILNADYSSLEPRAFAFMSGENRLKEIYKQDQDMYSKVYCDMMKEEYRNLKKSGENHIRNQFKPVALGIVYGARGPQVANLMGLRKTVNFDGVEKEILDVDKGNYYLNLFKQTYPNLTQYMKDKEMEANINGFVETIVGRRRHFTYTKPMYKLLTQAGMDYEDFLDLKSKELKTYHLNDVMDSNALKRLAKECGFNIWDEKTNEMRDWGFVRALYKNELNNAKNFPIQGLAAHITNRAMLDMTRAYKKENIDARVILQVHDEITSYVHREDAEIAREIKKYCMEDNKFARLVDVEMVADPLICDNLKYAK